jgi:hypothetical protein
VSAIGDDITVTFTFTLLGTSTAADPDLVQVIHRKPDLSETVYEYLVDDEITRTSAGLYTITLRLTEYRTHWFRPVGTGNVNKATEVSVDVEESYYLEPLPD